MTSRLSFSYRFACLLATIFVFRMEPRAHFPSFLCLAMLFAPALPAQPQQTDCTQLFALPEDELHRAICFAQRNNWPAAEQSVVRYRALHPLTEEAAILHAQILLELHLPGDASEVLSRVLALSPRSIAILTFYSQLSEKLGQPEQAEPLLVRCTQYAPNDASVWVRLGDLHLRSNGSTAASEFARAIALEPGNALAHSGLASALALRSDFDGAQREFQAAADLNRHAARRNPEIDFRFAEFCRSNGNYSQGLTHYSSAIEEDSSFLDAYSGRALSYIKLGMWDPAEKDLEVCLRDESRRISSLNLLLKIYEQRGQTEKAKRCAAEIENLSASDLAAKHEGNYIADLLRKATLLQQQKKYAEAAEQYTQLLREHPGVDSAWYGLGLASLGMGSLDLAEGDFRHYLQTNASSPSGLLALGKVLLKKRQWPQARAELVSARDLDPLLLEARMGIAASFIEQSNFKDAIAELQQADLLPGVHTETHLMLAEALYKDQQPVQALHEIDLALLEDPANPTARKMRAALQSPN